MTPRTNIVVSKLECRIGDNVFHLISKAYLSLERNGKKDLAEEMQRKIDSDAESPEDVLKIVKEYITIR